MATTEPTDPFAGVPADLREAMSRRGFEGLTPVQRAVISGETRGRDLRISSETGSGKTVALGLLLERDLDPGERARDAAGPEALVIVPTRELAMQVRDELAWLLRRDVGVVMGGTSIQGERRMLASRPAILVATPGRLLDHLRGGGVALSQVRQVALDEADRMLDMGFREDLEAIVEQLPPERRSHLVSATFPQAVLHLADRLQHDPVHVQGTRLGEANPDIEHVVHVVLREERYAALVNTLLLHLGQRCLVFVERRADAAQVADRLCADGFAAAALSGDLAQAQRTRTLHAFRTGAVDILVATDVAARGLDVTDIALVIHGDLPGDADTYTHRSGRTGRAGQRGRSVLFVTPAGTRRVQWLLRTCGIDASWAPPPGPKQVRKSQRKRQRRALHALLEDGPQLDAAALEYAAGLLEERDATEVVAALLKLSEPELPREPVELTPPVKNRVRREGPPPRRGPHGGAGRRERPGRPARPAHGTHKRKRKP